MPHRQTDTNSSGFTVLVIYDDPRWREIRRDSYAYVNSDLKPEHFPISGRGTSEVMMEYVTFDHEPATYEVLDEIKRCGLRCPDRAEAESFLDTHPEEQKKFPVIGLDGFDLARDSCRSVAYVNARGGERYLHFAWLNYRWFQDCRFLAVRK